MNLEKLRQYITAIKVCFDVWKEFLETSTFFFTTSALLKAFRTGILLSSFTPLCDVGNVGDVCLFRRVPLPFVCLVWNNMSARRGISRRMCVWKKRECVRWMKYKKEYACLHTHATAIGLMGADTLTASLSSLSGPLAFRICVYMHVCSCAFMFCVLWHACVCACASACVTPNDASCWASREFFNPQKESDSFTFKWESGRPSLWTICFAWMESVDSTSLHSPTCTSIYLSILKSQFNTGAFPLALHGSALLPFSTRKSTSYLVLFLVPVEPILKLTSTNYYRLWLPKKLMYFSSMFGLATCSLLCFFSCSVCGVKLNIEEQINHRLHCLYHILNNKKQACYEDPTHIEKVLVHNGKGHPGT